MPVRFWIALLAILACSLYPTTQHAQQVTQEAQCDNDPDFQKGISVVLYGNDTTMAINTPAFFDDLDARNLGVQSIILTFPIFMDSQYSVSVYEDDALTPSPENLAIFAQEAHSRCYSLWFKPLIDDDRMGAWRGVIQPGGDLANLVALDQWFASYTQLMLKYAQVAEATQVEGVIIGTELVTLDKNLEKYTSRWQRLIMEVSGIYGGSLAYAMNWNPPSLPGFAADLDVLMIDAFYDLAYLPNYATEEEIYRAWHEWLPVIEGYRLELGIPVMFAEVGIVPRVGAYRQPWNGDSTREADFEAQARYYAATCRFARENVDGMYWWAVGFYDHFTNQYQRFLDEGVLTYNFYDFPAEAELADCYNDDISSS